MRTIAKLFGRSPFAPLQAHMEKVADCIKHTFELFQAFQAGDFAKVEQLAETISKLEHEADLTKNDIRNHLPTSLFIPVDRGNLLEVLHIQDNIADKAEDIGVLLNIRKLAMIPDIKEEFQSFLDKNFESFEAVHQIIEDLNDIFQSSFGGIEAEKIKDLVDEVAYKEHQVDLLQRKLLKKLFNNDYHLSHQEFILWLRLFEAVGAISNLSEKLANRVLLTMEFK